MQQNGPQQDSPIPGKKQNCNEFGTYEPAGATSKTKFLCQGGMYEGRFYLPCPVRVECLSSVQALKARSQNQIEMRPPAPEERRFINPWQLPKLRAPNYGELPTQIPQSQASTQAKATVNAAVDAAQKATQASTPHVVQPGPDAPPGMRTPYAAPSYTYGESSPTFLPDEHESIWDRLWKNIVQGMISAIGWHVYNMARMVDFFG